MYNHRGKWVWPLPTSKSIDKESYLFFPAWQDLDKGTLQEIADNMAELHTEDNFMYHNCRDAKQASWENQLLDDYDTVSRDYRDSHLDKTVQTDPLVYRITHQRGPKIPNRQSIMDQHEEVDWSAAPLWARFWARDADGSCRWYDSTPVKGNGCWRSRVDCDWTAVAPNFNVKVRGWSETLRERVKTDSSVNQITHQRGPKVSANVDLTKPLSQQIGGDHYRQGSIQPIEYIHANNMDFFSGNVVKYITRWKYKNGLEDLKKAKHYIELLIEQEYPEQARD